MSDLRIPCHVLPQRRAWVRPRLTDLEASDTFFDLKETFRAGIAQLVERNLAKVEVAGSNPVSRSILRVVTCGDVSYRTPGPSVKKGPLVDRAKAQGGVAKW